MFVVIFLFSEVGVFVVTLAEISLAETLEQNYNYASNYFTDNKNSRLLSEALVDENINKHIYSVSLFSAVFYIYI
jgi:hypothetical protein